MPETYTRPKVFWLHRHFGPALRDSLSVSSVKFQGEVRKMIRTDLSFEDAKDFDDLRRRYLEGPETLPYIFKQMVNVPTKPALAMLALILSEEGMISVSKTEQFKDLINKILSPVQAESAPDVIKMSSGTEAVKGTRVGSYLEAHVGDTLKLRGCTSYGIDIMNRYGPFWRVTGGTDSRKPLSERSWVIQNLHWKDAGIKKPAGKQVIEVLRLKQIDDVNFEIVAVHPAAGGKAFCYKDYA